MKLQSLQLLAIFFIPVAVCPGQIISTVVGTPTCCNSADGIQATSTWLASLDGFTLDRVGNLYFGQGARIRKVSSSGVVTTVAGNGNFGYTGDGGPATSAQLFPNTGLRGIVVDEGGNIYFSDGNNHVIRKVSASGIITTVAGNGAPGYSGDGGKATAAMLQYPTDIALDAAGNLYIADNSNSRVRKVTPAGIITTFAGNGNVAYSGDGVQATTASVHAPSGLAFDSAGNLYISEGSDSRVRRVDTSGIITTVAGLTKKTIGFSGDGGPATAATLSGPIGLSVDQSGNLYIADNSNGRIRKVDAAGTITTFAGITGNASSPIGDNGPATSAYLGVPTCVKVDAAGTVYLSGSAAGVGRIRKVTAAAGLSASPSSLSFAFSIGGATPAAQSLSVTSSGGAAAFTAVATTTSGGNWLSVTPGSGTAPASLSVSVNPAGLPGGAYQGAITLTPSGGAASSFAVTLTVTGAGAPVFSGSAVFNALGYQNKLAPGTVFVIFGSAMGPANLVSVAGPDYPVSAGGTSVTFTPAAGGAAVSARMIYSSAGQLAGLLPSSITPGAYAVRITYNTLASAPQTVNVVARSFGIATSNSGGTGTAQATIGNVNGGVSLTRFTTGAVSFGGLDWTLTPAHPGDTLVLWGTGGGADPSNDNGGSSGDQTRAGNFTVTVAGRQITPIYAGASSGYAGLWQINFTLPSDISPECFASLQVTAGGELSNAVTLPIAPSGQDFCADPQLSRDALTLLDKGGTVALGGLAISKATVTNSLIATPGAAVTTTTAAQETITGGFPVYTATEFAAVFSGVKIGPCTVTDRTASATTRNPATPEGYLDAGASLPVNGPGLSAGAALTVYSTNPGPVYALLPTNGTIAGGGKYTLTGNGGKGVGPFTAAVTFPTSFTIANWDSLNIVDRSKPLTLNWTGSGFDQVYLIGSSSQVVGKDASNTNIIHTVAFTCTVPAAPGSYAIPTAVLSYLLPGTLDAASLAKGSTSLAVEALTSQPFSVSVLSGSSLAAVGFTATLSYSRNFAVQ